jgi:hypothetical protein
VQAIDVFNGEHGRGMKRPAAGAYETSVQLTVEHILDVFNGEHA